MQTVMGLPRARGGVFAAFVFGAAALAGGAVAADFPNKAVRMVTGSAPGGGSDTVARTLSEKLNERFGQPVLVDNRAGAEPVTSRNGLLGKSAASAAGNVSHDSDVTTPAPMTFNKLCILDDLRLFPDFVCQGSSTMPYFFTMSCQRSISLLMNTANSSGLDTNTSAPISA